MHAETRNSFFQGHLCTMKVAKGDYLQLNIVDVISHSYIVRLCTGRPLKRKRTAYCVVISRPIVGKKRTIIGWKKLLSTRWENWMKYDEWEQIIEYSIIGWKYRPLYKFVAHANINRGIFPKYWYQTPFLICEANIYLLLHYCTVREHNYRTGG